MCASELVYLPQWDLEFFKNPARPNFPICMTYAAFSYGILACRRCSQRLTVEAEGQTKSMINGNKH